MFSLRKIDKELKPLADFYSEDALAAMSKYGTIITIAPGQTFFEEGRTGAEAAVIIEGIAKVMAGGKTLATLTAGTLVGESAMLSGEPRNASAKAATLLRLVVLNPKAFSITLNACEHFRANVNATLEDRAA